MSEQATIIDPANHEQVKAFQENMWAYLSRATLVNLRRLRDDLFTWRRGSAQMALQVSPRLDNFSIYSVLVTNVPGSEELYRHLLSYNALQRRESLAFVEREQNHYVVLKYTMEAELGTESIVQRHVYALQETADQLDTQLVQTFGGSLHFEDWDKMDQAGVDNLLGALFD